MDNLVILTMNGELKEKIYVTLEIRQEGQYLGRNSGYLPPCPELAIQYERWQSSLCNFQTHNTRIKIKKNTNGDIIKEFENRQIKKTRQDCHDAELALSELLNSWLKSKLFSPIRDKLNGTILNSNQARILLRTSNPELKKLPWNLWEWLSQENRQAEIILSTLDCEAQTPILRDTIKVLIILGDSEGINTEIDSHLLSNNLPHAQIDTLIKPTRQELDSYLWDNNFDILFFAGHSETINHKGIIYINDSEFLEIENLKYSLKKSISQGLKLAIFNSCDGLGLAYDLETLQIPNMIVMRDIVPDKVAQQFLSNLIQEFIIDKKPLHLAGQQARKKLQGLENEFPCASWIPVMFQNTTETPQFWDDWIKNEINTTTTKVIRPQPIETTFLFKSIILLIIILLLNSLMPFIRSNKFLIEAENWIYDRMIASRPKNEKLDSRIAIVEITEQDLQKWDEHPPLTDKIVLNLLQKLSDYQPKVIGLDIYRDKDLNKEHPELHDKLIKHLQKQGASIVSACSIPGNNKQENPGYLPPANIPKEHLGFTNFANNQGEIIRHQLLGMKPVDTKPGTCNTTNSLSLRLALRYLKKEVIKNEQDTNNLQIGNYIIKTLRKDSQGYQVLLNYRSSEQVAHKVTLTQVLESKIDPNLLKDKIVLIGYTAQSAKDIHPTPYSNEQHLMPGVIVHAHMTSQIISFVEDGRPMLNTLSELHESILIFGCTVAGGIIVWRLRSLSLIISEIIIIIVLCTSSFWLFYAKAIWIPLFASILTFNLVIICVLAISYLFSLTNNQN